MHSPFEDAPPEYRAIYQLVGSGMDTKKLLRAATTFHAKSLEMLERESGDLVVQSGLFKGSRLFPYSTASHLLPKIQGTYEKEVQDFLLKVSSMFDRFLDIGCAEGYYLAGVSEWKKVPCFGIDIDDRARSAFEYLSAVPGMKDLLSFSTDIADATRFLSGRLACIVDIDGGEMEVIEKLDYMFSSSSLRSCILIVESDSKDIGIQNYHQIAASLITKGWRLLDVLNQEPRYRFIGSKSHMSLLDQFMYGWEGRPGAQCWVAVGKDF